MINVVKSHKKKNAETPLYDLSTLPEEYLKNEYPEVYNSLRKRKYDLATPYFP
ncbi:hypothetical protein [Stygiolobus caldivivus]|uniref:Uncharacterized protein n=1 Tax=Stygiolobus caldivivus TaxID=2824673 RepID=A0A8D5U4H4_9CREN|nr:hypothetical protein [Stygiolobus caldivivus]BCU69087.1 hypothetical protein KN1_03840 [Stygiolobus caldivivus]